MTDRWVPPVSDCARWGGGARPRGAGPWWRTGPRVKGRRREHWAGWQGGLAGKGAGRRRGERVREMCWATGPDWEERGFPFSYFKTNFKYNPNWIWIWFKILFSIQIKMSNLFKFSKNKFYNFLNSFNFIFFLFFYFQSHFNFFPKAIQTILNFKQNHSTN